ncbi:aminodeoxychorismate synthase component I [Streptomyces sp. NPDC020681]|uniref:aminodeoxychorismate synthase component I n=1 Tax=Streptomyces sp. NPDC020681 TaxID=3365083 RepID=UPI00379C0A56
MRTLLIDNYDSFTHILAHLIAGATGTAPVVVSNDEPDWSPDILDRFDSVVISPGPGHPRRLADFGVCAETIAHSRLPLLGVCLGFQGICEVFGGRVGRAPETRHGRTSEIRHSGTDLFAGVPSPFHAVRYHSLAVQEVPAELEVTAWAEDDVVMAVRHRQRPIWGVQFHPESICTEHGQRIMENFVDLTQNWHTDPRRPGRLQDEAGDQHGNRRRRSPHGDDCSALPALPHPPSSPAARPRAAGQQGTTGPIQARTVLLHARPGPASLHLLHRELPFQPPAEAVFDALYSSASRSFWLDSSQSGGPRGRISVMGDATGPLARTATFDAWSETVTVRSAQGEETVPGPFFDWLDADLRNHRVEIPDLPFDFTLGWVGYLGYELKAECGGDRVHKSPFPDAGIIFADRAVVFDHARGVIHLLALGRSPDDHRAHAWFSRTRQRIRRLADDPDSTVHVPRPTAAQAWAPRLRHDRHRYLKLIESTQRDIAAGESYEVCLTNMLSVPGRLDPWPAYLSLRRANPVPFAAFLRLNELAVLSSSPERFLKISRDGTAMSSPIKGTRPRSSDPREDELLRRDLESSTKDRAENLMIVDLVRSDLASCSVQGSVDVPSLFSVESYTTVHQMVSTVRSQLAPGVSAVRCVQSAFPGGSMTGAPKIRTMQIIDRLEAGPRGVYSGALGYFSLSGAADLSIVIRTAVCLPERTEFGVGGAILALSDPSAEYEETAVKAAPLLRLLRQSFPGRHPQRQTPAALGRVSKVDLGL